MKAFPPATVVALLLSAVLQAPAVTVTHNADSWRIENAALIVTVRPEAGLITAKQKKTGYVWSQAGAPGQKLEPLLDVHEIGSPVSGVAFETTAAANTNLIRAKLYLKDRGADLFTEVDLPDHNATFRELFPLHPFVLNTTNAAMVVADYSDGHIYSLNAKPRNAWFNLWSIDMPWVGVVDTLTGRGYALIVETDDDALIRAVKVESTQAELWMPQAGFQPSRGDFNYQRRLFYHFSDTGGYVSLAKRFRQYASDQGLIITFTEKLKRNPNIRRIFGAPDVWGNSSLNFAREAKAAGIEKMIIHGRSSQDEMKAINDLGYLTSEYDNYTDILPLEAGKGIDAQHGRLPEDAVLRADGERMKAWLTWDKKQFMKRCPSLWVPAAKEVVPQVLEKSPYLGRFTDVTTAEDLYECYDANHPLSRSAKRECGVQLLGYMRSLGLVTGGEHGRYWAVPQLDYIEGMQSGGSFSWPSGWLLRPKTKDQEFDNPWGGKFGKWADYEQWGIGHAARVPLWELVFHDCVVSTWYWGDSSDFLLQAAPEVTAKKDAFNVLYGTIPLLWANKEGGWTTARELFLRTYRNTCKLHEEIADKELVSHTFVTNDRAVQSTRFSNGTEVVVNFGANPFKLKFKGKTYLLPQNGFVVKGTGIEQSIVLRDGKRVTTIRHGKFEHTETE